MRIAHISDFHLRKHTLGHPSILKRRSRLMPELIPEAVQKIRSLKPDVLAVTGDLVDTPFYGMSDPNHLERARQDQHLVRDLIDPVGCPVFYIYGNHDHGQTFRQVFPDQEPDQSISGYRFISYYDEQVTENWAERLGEQRDRFSKVLMDDDPTPQIHLQHYMIWPEHNAGYPHAYREAKEMKAQIESSRKVALSLSGHYHVGADATYEKGTWFATSRAFCEPPHPFRIYDLDGDQVSQTEYSLDRATPGRTLFVDIYGILSPLRQDATLSEMLVGARANGWIVIGIGIRSPSPDSEAEYDQLIGELTDAGFELDGAICRVDNNKLNAQSLFTGAFESLGIQPGLAQAVVGFDRLVTGATDAGVQTTRTTPQVATQALSKVIEQ